MFTKLQNIVSTVAAYLVGKLGLPPAAAQVVTHAVVVFAVTFGAQVTGAATGHFNWGTLPALVVAAAAAGASAALHYLVGLIPTAAAKKASK